MRYVTLRYGVDMKDELNILNLFNDRGPLSASIDWPYNGIYLMMAADCINALNRVLFSSDVRHVAYLFYPDIDLFNYNQWYRIPFTNELND